MSAPKCLRCGSYALNLWRQDRISTELCDVCYWKDQASQVADLKARLKEVREATSFAVKQGLKLPGLTARTFECTDLRVKNWRQP